MTRETRIGLLVGLLFIVLFGLVLSELTGTGSTPPAPPGAEENPAGLAGAPAVEEPSVPVGYMPRAAEAEMVTMGPPAREQRGGVIEATISPGLPPRRGVLEARVYADGVLAARETRPNPAGGAAAGGPAPAAPAPPQPAAPGAGPTGPAGQPTPAGQADRPGPAPRVYKVEANDSLIRIARKVYGAGNEQMYRLIYRANRRVLPNESTLSIGQELVIPPLPQRPPQGAAGRTELTAEQLARRLDAVGSAGPAPRGRGTHVVQRGETLWSVARKAYGRATPALVRKIFQANRDRMANPNDLEVGTKLTIPR